MKNKIMRFAPLFFIGISCFSLSACKNNSENNSNKFEKIRLDYGTYRTTKLDSITSLHELTYDELSSKITHKSSFLLAIYNETCTCWSDFAPVLTDFINDTGCNVDYIDSENDLYPSDHFPLVADLY